VEFHGPFWAVFAVPHSKRRLVEAFGHVVREARIRAGMTQEKLSFRAAVHRTYVSDLERGLKSPTLDVIDAIAVALNTESYDLLELAVHLRDRPPREWTTHGSRQRVRRKR